jgi:hypothetical protein
MTSMGKGRIARWTGRVLVCIWAPCILFVVATLMAGHWSTLPKPAAMSAVGRGPTQNALRQFQAGRWLAVHVLYSKCECSRRILQHLFERRVLADVAELVVLVGGQPAYEQRARNSGYALDVVTPPLLLQKYGFEGAPLFVVADPKGGIRYLGGYTERKQGLAVQDVQILSRLRRQEHVAELPLFGCAVSRSLQALLDPLGIKYRDQS